MWLQTRMFLLVALMFAILYGAITGVGIWAGGASYSYLYIVMAFVFLGLQYLIGPAMVGWTMGVKYVSEREEPELHRIVTELAAGAGIPKPRVGISRLNIPNAFAFGRTRHDWRVCVTRGILNLLN